MLACTANIKNNEPAKIAYCPLNNFFLGWERAAYRIDHMFEAAPTPCEKEPVEKSSLFAIDKKGNGIAEFEGKEITLKPAKAIFQKGTLLWSQVFINDSLNLKFFLDNYKLINKGHHYYYNSKLSFNIIDSLYEYEMEGWCDSIAVHKLLKK